MRLSKRSAPQQEPNHKTIDSRSSPTTIYVADESLDETPVKNIRQRNKSNSISFVDDGFYTPFKDKIPKVSGSPSSIMTIPGYDFKYGSPDSGYNDSISSSTTFTPSSVR